MFHFLKSGYKFQQIEFEEGPIFQEIIREKAEDRKKNCRGDGIFSFLVYSLLAGMVHDTVFRKFSRENLFLKVVVPDTSKY